MNPFIFLAHVEIGRGLGSNISDGWAISGPARREILHIPTSFGPGRWGRLVIYSVNFLMVMRITELESEVPVLVY